MFFLLSVCFSHEVHNIWAALEICREDLEWNLSACPKMHGKTNCSECYICCISMLAVTALFFFKIPQCKSWRSHKIPIGRIIWTYAPFISSMQKKKKWRLLKYKLLNLLLDGFSNMMMCCKSVTGVVKHWEWDHLSWNTQVFVVGSVCALTVRPSCCFLRFCCFLYV